MVEPATEAIAVSPPRTAEKEIPVIYISSASSSSSLDSSCYEEEDTPPIFTFRFKKMEDLKHYEETEDCFVLDSDPTETIDFSKLALVKNLPAVSDDGDDNELSVVAESGKNSSPSASSPHYSFSKEEGSPLRSIVCLKNKEDVKRYEETEDCFILDFDPTESFNFFNLSVSKHLSSISGDDDGSDNELSVIAETGKVACRDYPHSRHLCVKFPFNTTSHELHCEMCYCYVCDSAAPCKDWTKETIIAHCHASEKVGMWNIMRRMKKTDEALV